MREKTPLNTRRIHPAWHRLLPGLLLVCGLNAWVSAQTEAIEPEPSVQAPAADVNDEPSSEYEAQPMFEAPLQEAASEDAPRPGNVRQRVEAARRAALGNQGTATAQPADEAPKDEPQATQPATPTADPVEAKPAVKVIPEPQPWSHYRPLVERNMFTRTQPGSRRPGRDDQATQPPAATQPARPRSSWILTGVVLHGDGRVAFFENSLSGMTMRVEVGQEIGSSILRAVADDHVRLESQDQQMTRVEVGQSVDGSGATLSASPRSSIFGDGGEAAATQGADGGSENSAESSSGMSVAERMRARRRQQMNR